MEDLGEGLEAGEPLRFGAGLRLIVSRAGLWVPLWLVVWLPMACAAAVAEVASGIVDAAAFAAQCELLGHLAGAIVIGGTLVGLARSDGGERPSFGASLRAGIAAWGWLVVGRLAFNAIVGVGLLCLIVPGLVAAVRLSLVGMPLVLEGAGVRQAFRESIRLTRGRSLRLAGWLAGALGLAILVAALAGGVSALLEAVSRPAAALFWLLVAPLPGLLLLFVLYSFYRAARLAEPAAAPPPTARRFRLRHAAVVLLMVALTLSPAFRSVAWEWNDVPTGAMIPTVLPGDRVVVEQAAYRLRWPFTEITLRRRQAPRRGDVVVLRSPEGSRLLKRIVAGPGDRVEVAAGRLTVNGVAAKYQELRPVRPGVAVFEERIANRAYEVLLREPLSEEEGRIFSLRLPHDAYCVLGDNRWNSRDSRVFGPVQESAVLARVRRVALSIDVQGYYAPRWERFGLSIEPEG